MDFELHFIMWFLEKNKKIQEFINI